MDSGASLHMMSKNELTSVEKETIRESKVPTVIMTANGMGESTNEATVYVNDFGRLCHDKAVGRFTGSAITGLIMRRNGLVLQLKKECLHRRLKMNT